MWKETYKIGVEFIDRQHKDLFDTTEKLLRIIQDENVLTRKQECVNTITFLKDYCVEHFAAEEAYQLSINYSEADTHKVLHRVFVTSLGRLENKLNENDFDMPTIKEFAGFLMTWLSYHVAGADQKLKKQDLLPHDKASAVADYVERFAQSAPRVLKTMAGVTASNITYSTYHGTTDDVRIMVGLIGDYSGEAVFTFTKEITYNLFKQITSMTLTAIDELAYSALSEIANIISGDSASLISESGKVCDIKTPKVISDFGGIDNRSGFYLDTEYGRIAISISIE